MKKLLAVLVVLHCGCTLFKDSPNFEPNDSEGSDTGSDSAVDTDPDVVSENDIGVRGDVALDVIEDVVQCPQDTAGCAPAETIGCSELGFDRGTATCDNCEWITTECGTCDFFFSELGDDGNDGGSIATAFRTLQPLDEKLAEDGDGSNFCFERGSRFGVSETVNIARGNILITEYGDPSNLIPVFQGVEVLVEASEDPEFTHEATLPTDRPVSMIWTSDDWFEVAYAEPIHTARQDGNRLYFSAAASNVPGYVSPPEVFTTLSDNARSNVSIEQIKFQNVRTGISFGAASQDTNDFDFRALEFESVIIGIETASTPVQGAFVQLRGIRIRDSLFKNYVVGARVRSMPENSQDDNVVIEGNVFEAPYDYRTSEIISGQFYYPQPAAIQIDAFGRATAFNNRIDLADSVFGTGISLFGFGNEFFSVPYRSGTVLSNVVIGGRRGISCDIGGQQTTTLIANNIVVGSEVGISAQGGKDAPVIVAHNVVMDTLETGIQVLINSAQAPGNRVVGNIVQTDTGFLLSFNGPSEQLECDYNLYNRVSIWRQGSGELTNFDAWRAEGYGLDSNASADPLPAEINALSDYATVRDVSVRSVDAITEGVEVDFFGTVRPETPTIGAIEVPSD